MLSCQFRSANAAPGVASMRVNFAGSNWRLKPNAFSSPIDSSSTGTSKAFPVATLASGTRINRWTDKVAGGVVIVSTALEMTTSYCPASSGRTSESASTEVVAPSIGSPLNRHWKWIGALPVAMTSNTAFA